MSWATVVQKVLSGLLAGQAEGRLVVGSSRVCILVIGSSRVCI
jgi:hypothetical protein